MIDLVARHPVKNVVQGHTNHFRRTELKYLVHNSVIDGLLPYLESHMELDKFSEQGFYSIYSVYFDTQDWQAFYSKLDGAEHRQKFRIRSYYSTPGINDHVFIEIKEKFDLLVTKRRDAATLGTIQNLMDGAPSQSDSAVYDEWRYNIIRNTIKPRLLNSYDRLAFESIHYPGLRVTLDRNISAAMTNTIDFDMLTRPLFWADNYSVVEIKFREYVPEFIMTMLRHNNLSREAISKYCYSVMSNYLLV